MSDSFADRLKAAKQKQIPTPEVERIELDSDWSTPEDACDTPRLTVSEIRRIDFELKLAKLKNVLFHWVLAIAVVTSFLNFYCMRDWWRYLETPEYRQYKQRISR